MSKCIFYDQKIDRCMNVNLASVLKDCITLHRSYESCGDNCHYYKERSEGPDHRADE